MTGKNIQVLDNFFEYYNMEDCLFGAARDLIELINDNDRFQVIGWEKRGKSKDQGVYQTENLLPPNASRLVV